MKKFVQSHQLEVILVIGLLLLTAFFHGFNMLHFPFFENDEGTYFAQAWSFLSQGKLAPYTYWYDHAPFGWMFTSVWILLTGGLFTFGFSLNSARIFMLVIHVCSALLLYILAKKITHSKVAASLSVILFSLSPLAVYFQRRMLLDNLMIFWILVTSCLILNSRGRLRGLLLSAISFGLAVLTKENAIFFLPVMVWLVAREAHPGHRRIAVIKWLGIAGSVISIYPLYAQLKGELFPMGSWLSPPTPHVSLLETLKMQASRGSGKAFWQVGSDFRTNLAYWAKQDPWFVRLSIVAFIWQGILAVKNRRSRAVFLLALPQVLFIMSGKLVINFYVISLIPFMSLAMAFSVAQAVNLLKKIRPAFGAIVVVAVLALMFSYYPPLIKPYLTLDETTAQEQAVTWIKTNVDPHSFISIDFYSYLDLTYARKSTEPRFNNADWFWKVELDPDISDKKLHNNFTNINYVMLSAEAQRQILNFPTTSLLRKALTRSQPIAAFSSDPQFAQNFVLDKPLQPNGDWVVMYHQLHMNLAKAWQTYKVKFFNSAGYIQPPEDKNAVTSEGQSYALLRAVWMNDQSTFDSTYTWTKTHMQLKNSHLFGWKWLLPSKHLVDQGNAPDADQDIAMALLFAGKQWANPTYTAAAKAMIQDIWRDNVFTDDKYSFVTAGNWAVTPDYVTLNPSYLAPYEYRLFAEVDPEHDWTAVVDSSYQLLTMCSTSLLDKNYSTSLPPEWCRYERTTKALVASRSPQPEDSNYGYNAFRVPWKIYLDYQWNHDPRAIEYLKRLSFLIEKEDQGTLVDVYSHDAVAQTKVNRYANIMDLPVFVASGDALGQQFYANHFFPIYHEDDQQAYWYEGDEYYLQNWAWFAAGIYQEELPNLMVN